MGSDFATRVMAVTVFVNQVGLIRVEWLDEV